MLFRTDQNVSDPNIFNTGISVNQDPAFVNGSGDDYHLTENSFARNKGLPSPDPVTFTDLDGDSRPCFSEFPIGQDLGCYEYCP